MNATYADYVQQIFLKTNLVVLGCPLATQCCNNLVKFLSKTEFCRVKIKLINLVL